jgi:hypothetical protein
MQCIKLNFLRIRYHGIYDNFYYEQEHREGIFKLSEHGFNVKYTSEYDVEHDITERGFTLINQVLKDAVNSV